MNPSPEYRIGVLEAALIRLQERVQILEAELGAHRDLLDTILDQATFTWDEAYKSDGAGFVR